MRWIRALSIASASIIVLWSQLSGSPVAAQPSGGAVVDGQAVISAVPTGIDVQQQSQNAVINWQSFSLGAAHTANFHLPNSSAAVLNRVTTDGLPSEIFGTINSNGNVYLINPAGVVIGPTGVINAHGFTASALDIPNAEFMRGGNLHFRGSGDGTILNQGTIVTGAGGVALIGGNVINQGTIISEGGSISLIVGKDATLTTAGKYIQADNATLMNGVSEYVGVINNEGVIRATGAAHVGGEVYLVNPNGVVLQAGIIAAQKQTEAEGLVGGAVQVQADAVVNTGKIDASGTSGGRIDVAAATVVQQGDLTANAAVAATADVAAGDSVPTGNGGEINIRYTMNYLDTLYSTLQAQGASGGMIRVAGEAGTQAFVSGTFDASAFVGQGGVIALTGETLVLRGATLKADGYAGGGNVFVGGGYQGIDASLFHAGSVDIGRGVRLSADALGAGNGGLVVVWSDDVTSFGGSISARGGATAGDGGFLEVSGLNQLTFSGSADASSPAGLGGTLLLDPHTITVDNVSAGPLAFEFTDPNPKVGNDFGNVVIPLSTGNVVVSVANTDLGSAVDAGAVYLFDGSNGGLISALVGSTSNDKIGNATTDLGNGNFVVRSGNWNGNRGAVTWGSGTSGIAGVVSAANSLVGTNANDQVGNNGVTLLGNGNYVVLSSNWNGARGAVTWGSGTSAIVGELSAGNSLVGTNALDRVGSGGITVLGNGNYVVGSSLWSGLGAATWGSGTSGIVGEVSAANSLVGTTANDQVGSGITALGNGNYAVVSTRWNVSRGAVTWGSGTSGIIGAVTAANSLVGTNANDLVGNGGITLLGNGNFVVRSFSWNGSRGAVTWGSGTSGIVGEVSAANSLVGTNAGDQVGGGVTALGNGNYVVRSTFWNGFRGAVTWGSGTSGITGAVSAANSLIGSNENDSVGGNGITALTNGNYVVGSANWNGNRGAATWGSGTSGIIGAVSAANSLVGTNGNDQVGGGVTALGNGNYVVRSSGWNVSRGAATWGSGTSGIVGAVSAANSLVGTNANDQVGAGITLLGNGNYVVRSQNWNGSRGAATWGSGTSGITGAVSAANSLIGTNANDVVSNGGITVLSNGNYVVSSGKWNGFRGAVTWGSGTSGVVGEVSAANSLVGTTANDQVGGVGITALGNGNYVVLSANWNDARGAATWGSGTSGIVGVVSAANSLVGTNANDRVGNRGVTVLGNGNYVVGSSNWNGARGAATWGSGTSEIVGEVSAANSLVGTNANDQVGDGVTPLGNGNYVVRSGSWNGSRGAATWGSGTSGIGGEVSAVNSLVGGVPSSGLSGIDVDSVHETFIASFRTDTSDGFGGRLRVGLWNQVLVFTGDFSNFGNVPAQDVTITPGMITAITNNGTAVVLAANTDIVVKQAIVANNPGGTGGHLSLLAGRSILINANIDTDGGDLTLWANHPAGDGVTGPLNANRDAGLAVITMAAGTSIDTGAGNFIARIDTGAGLTNNASGNLTLATVNSGGSVLIENRGPGSAGVWGDIIIASNTITITGGEGTTLRSLGDIYAYVSILNTAGTAAGQGGSVNLIAGWNGVTGLATPFDMTPIFADTASYGNNSGSVYINRENGAGTTGVAVGSRYGATNVAAFDLTLRGGNTDDAYAQLGFRANTSVDFFLIDSPITAVVKNNISVTAGTGLRSYAQVGHGAAFTSNHSGHLYFGEIALTLGGRLALAGVATGDRYSAIGHGDQPGNDDTGDAVGGDVTLRIGQGADLTTAFIGHLIDASGVYFSGKTYISVGTGNYVGTNQTDALVSDAASRINSAANAGGGQLRFYLPQRSSFQMADGTLVNGIDVATFKSSSPLANTQGVFSPFNGPYVVDLSAGNFAFYLSAIPSTGGPTPTPPVDVPVPPNAFSRVFGAILGSIVNDQFGRSEDYFKSIYSLSQGGVRNLGGIDFGPGVGGTITIDVEAESETNLGSEDGALD